MSTNTKQISTALGYAFKPALLSPLKQLGRYVSYFAYLLATVFASFRIIPRNHPTLMAKNFGRYGIGYVFTTALNNIVLSKKNIDQILVFIAVCLTFVLVILQMLFAVLSGIFMSSAKAGNVFVTPSIYADKDVSLQLLQNAFGLGKSGSGFFFKTPVAADYDAFQTIHEIFYQMMAIYSTGMMIIAVLLVIYYVFAVVGESAYTGKPFGNRFNGLYAPIRIVLGLGLLVPLGSGLNSAQYAVLYAAKFGVGLANNAWYLYVEAIGDPVKIQMKPDINSANELVTAIYRSELCKNVRNQIYPSGAIAPTLLITKNGSVSKSAFPAGDAAIQALADAGNRQADIVYTTSVGTEFAGAYCGKIMLDVRLATRIYDEAILTKPDYVIDAALMQEAQYKAFEAAYTTLTSSTAIEDIAKKYALGDVPSADERDKVAKLLKKAVDEYNTSLQSQSSTSLSEIFSAINTEGTGEKLKDELKKGGWATAGAYYSVIGRYIRFVSQAANIPSYKGYVIDPKRYTPAKTASDQKNIPEEDIKIEKANIEAEDFGSIIADVTPTNDSTTTACRSVGFSALGNAFKTGNWSAALDFIFDTCSLREMRESKTMDPMFYLVKFGNEKVSRSLQIIGVSLLSQVASSLLPSSAYQFVNAVGGLANFIAFLGLSAGITLAYILPLLPFIYYMIAILSWVLAIFQALLGLPLWALAHIRIEGDGIAGPVAENGYKFLLEIMLRPVLILLTLIGVFFIIGAANFYVASLFVESASNTVAFMLNSEFNAVEDFVMTLLYALMMYGIINTLVKLTDNLPQTVMTWGGMGAAYNDPLNGGIFEGHSTAFFGSMYAGLQTVNNTGTGLSKSINDLTHPSGPQKVAIVDGTPQNHNTRGGPR